MNGTALFALIAGMLATAVLGSCLAVDVSTAHVANIDPFVACMTWGADCPDISP